MVKSVIGIGLVIMAIIKGDIHDTTTYVSNLLFGVVCGLAPFMIELADVTELIKMVSSLLSLFLVSIAVYRAWKYKDKK